MELTVRIALRSTVVVPVYVLNPVSVTKSVFMPSSIRMPKLRVPESTSLPLTTIFPWRLLDDEA
jgi:hypothetical protein